MSTRDFRKPPDREGGFPKLLSMLRELSELGDLRDTGEGRLSPALESLRPKRCLRPSLDPRRPSLLFFNGAEVETSESSENSEAGTFFLRGKVLLPGRDSSPLPGVAMAKPSWIADDSHWRRPG